MVEKLEDVWFSRDLPVLVEVARCFDQGLVTGVGLSPVALLERLDPTRFDETTLGLSLNALSRRGLVTMKRFMQNGPATITSVDGTAYTLTGLHPDGDDIVDRLVSALRQAAEQTPDEDDRSTIRRAARHFADMPKNVAVGVISAVITGSL